MFNRRPVFRIGPNDGVYWIYVLLLRGNFSLPPCFVSSLSLFPSLPFFALTRTKLSLSPFLSHWGETWTASLSFQISRRGQLSFFILSFLASRGLLSLWCMFNYPSTWYRSVPSLGTVYRADALLPYPLHRSSGKRKTFIIVAAWDGSVFARRISKRIIWPTIICVLRLPLVDLLGTWHAIRRCSNRRKSDAETKGQAR